jgi:predicted phosphodiesterase
VRTLIVSDIHGNLEALNTVLENAGSFDRVICLGDIVGYGPQPNECIATVRGLPGLTCLAGNHDLGATGRIEIGLFSSGAARALLWTRQALRPDAMDYLMQLDPTGAAPNIALAHASPRDPVWEYLEYPQQAAANFGLFEQQACLVGHTHVPHIFEEVVDDSGRRMVQERTDVAEPDLLDGVRRILNPGSVGQPRDGDPRAAYALLNTGNSSFTLKRVAYDVQKAQGLILAAGLPSSLASRLSVGM